MSDTLELHLKPGPGWLLIFKRKPKKPVVLFEWDISGGSRLLHLLPRKGRIVVDP